jgi:hypothetical protein
MEDLGRIFYSQHRNLQAPHVGPTWNFLASIVDQCGIFFVGYTRFNHNQGMHLSCWTNVSIKLTTALIACNHCVRGILIWRKSFICGIVGIPKILGANA